MRKVCGQDALDRDGTNGRNQFQIPFHRRQIERQQVLPRLDARPAAQLVRRNDAVGLHVDLLDGELRIFIDQTVERPVARAPEQIQPEDRRERDAEAIAASRVRAARTWLERSFTSSTCRGPTAGSFLRLNHTWFN